MFFSVEWPAPDNICAVSTLRVGGNSLPPYDSLNLGTHVGDDVDAVELNRALLSQTLALPNEPTWLNQVHGTQVLTLPCEHDFEPTADASYTEAADQICVVMTADCLPVLFCSADGKEVAAAHAGWRGLADGVLEATLAKFQSPRDQILAWLGPAIGFDAFEVGAEVRAQFVQADSGVTCCFVPYGEDKYLADLYGLARLRLQQAGVTQVYGGDRCTFTEQEAFFSYRRDGQTGRQASLIWIEAVSDKGLFD